LVVFYICLHAPKQLGFFSFFQPLDQEINETDINVGGETLQASVQEFRGWVGNQFFVSAVVTLIYADVGI
jgi:hypothetical protein